MLTGRQVSHRRDTRALLAGQATDTICVNDTFWIGGFNAFTRLTHEATGAFPIRFTGRGCGLRAGAIRADLLSLAIFVGRAFG